MKPIDTHEVELAFTDLMNELKKIKDLNTIADSYKRNADSLAESIKILLDVSQKNNQNYSMLVQETLDKLNEQVKSIGTIGDNITALIDNIGNNISTLQQDIEKSMSGISQTITDVATTASEQMTSRIDNLGNNISLLQQGVEKSASETNRNITKAIASISDESNKVGKDMDAKYTSLKKMVSKTNSQTFWFGLLNMILIIILFIVMLNS